MVWPFWRLALLRSTPVHLLRKARCNDVRASEKKKTAGSSAEAKGIAPCALEDQGVEPCTSRMLSERSADELDPPFGVKAR